MLVEEQIRTLPTVKSQLCVSYVRAYGPGLYPETLVFLMRVGVTSGSVDLVDAAWSALLGKMNVEGQFEGGVRLVIWRLEIPEAWRTLESFIIELTRKSELRDGDEVDIFRAEFHYLILRRIRAGSRAQPYWEVNLRRALKNSVSAVWTALKPMKSRPGRAHQVGTVSPDRLAVSGASPDRVFANNEATTAVESALRKLPADEQEVIEELFMPDSVNGPPTQKDLAAELDVTEETIRNRRKRGLRKLRHLLGADHEWLKEVAESYVVPTASNGEHAYHSEEESE